ncbi:PREDICTED: transport and Golgi organization protein 6 [Drosophila arizonae]|uniref:Transport and Golgi organization protein 6 n=1 Tax=Drosophila arizonae TaxID=7263 RepID=A0ABM1NTA2_DROAR|nr:PREDICTED: transport and Golgi organization protein 6 [Drosophila arizonae]
MINTAKYFALLENLNFKHAASNAGLEVLQSNLKILSKYIQKDLKEQMQELCIALQVEKESDEIDLKNCVNCYIIQLLHVLHTLSININFHSDAKEDLISVAHLKLCIRTTQELSYYALRSQLHEDFYNSAVFKDVQRVSCYRSLVYLSVQMFIRLLTIRQLHIANAMELVQRDLLAAVISLRVGQPSQEQLLQLNAALAYLWQSESKADYFRHVLLLKATPNLSAPLVKELHHQLLSKLGATHGFASLLAALQTPNATQSAEIVAQIVAQRGFSLRLQQRLIEQIFDFCAMQANGIMAGVLSLRRLYELNVENRECVERLLSSHWLPLTSPVDLLNGLIIWEQAQLCACIRLWEQLFCSSSVACLPSVLLVPFVPLLLQLYKHLPQMLTERKALAALILRCLDNRESKQELPAVLQRLYSLELSGPPPWQALHTRLAIKLSSQSGLVTVQVEQQQEEENYCRALTALLKAGSDHTLTAKIFLALLGLMLQQLQANEPASTELLSTETELADFLHSKYHLKLELLVALEQLVWHEPLKAQLAATQSKNFIQLVAQLMAIKVHPSEMAEHMQLLILLLLQELLERSEQMQMQLSEFTRQLQQPLQKLASGTSNPLLLNALQPLLELVNGKQPSRLTSTAPASLASFQKARELIENEQPHLQVYGIQLMLEALRNKDPTFLSQSHRIIALALSTLKQKESYTFLNCVRLFVQLVHIMEAEVLDLLSDEYLSETADLDYRLVVGEAILKAAQEIGPLCYRYKAVLINCFLHGARSPLDEFRSSAYANLAQLCRLLTYQVHSFFQELLQLIDAELSSGRYLPAKRGALLVLAELLSGMDNLLNYQDMLLPIYRLLRAIEANESCDSQMRQHAANGLKVINEKCRELLKSEAPVQQLQREIKVLGIKEPSAKGKRHILELN